MTVKELKHQPDWFCLVSGGERYRTSLHCQAGESVILAGRNKAGEEVFLQDDDEVPHYGWNFHTAAAKKESPSAV